MTEDGALESGAWRVACRAGAGVVVRRCGVTRRAICEAGMVKPRLFPRDVIVAVGALPGIVLVGRVVFQVTGCTIAEPEVVEVERVPIGSVGVTAHTGVGVDVFTQRCGSGRDCDRPDTH